MDFHIQLRVILVKSRKQISKHQNQETPTKYFMHNI
jgi:hypothetical protein